MPDFMAGRHEAQIEALDGRCSSIEKTVNSMNGKLDKVIVSLAERRGERKAIALFATAMGGAGSLLVTILLKVFGS